MKKCEFCHENKNIVATSKVCSSCYYKIRYYKEFIEEGTMDPIHSKKCRDVLRQVEFNRENGGYVPAFFEGDLFVDIECESCGRSTRVVGDHLQCVRCRKLDRAWSVHVANKNKSIHDPGRKQQIYITYLERHTKGLKVPRSFLEILEAERASRGDAGT